MSHNPPSSLKHIYEAGEIGTFLSSWRVPLAVPFPVYTGRRKTVPLSSHIEHIHGTTKVQSKKGFHSCQDLAPLLPFHKAALNRVNGTGNALYLRLGRSDRSANQSNYIYLKLAFLDKPRAIVDGSLKDCCSWTETIKKATGTLKDLGSKYHQ